MKVVLDTNVIVSGLARNGNESVVLGMARDGLFEWYVSPFNLDETAGVLPRKFSWDPQRVAETLADLRTYATVVDPAPSTDAVPGGHADNRILDCAAAAGADFLVTGDARHLLPLGEHQGARIVNAVVFLEALRE